MHELLRGSKGVQPNPDASDVNDEDGREMHLCKMETERRRKEAISGFCKVIRAAVGHAGLQSARASEKAAKRPKRIGESLHGDPLQPSRSGSVLGYYQRPITDIM
jgi:hypothetical protein